MEERAGWNDYTIFWLMIIFLPNLYYRSNDNVGNDIMQMWRSQVYFSCE